jgi:hypothetical protein
MPTQEGQKILEDVRDVFYRAVNNILATQQIISRENLKKMKE